MRLTSQDIQLFDEIFVNRYGAGYVLNFSNKTMREFFEEQLFIDIDNDMYRDDGNSKAKRLRCFLKKSDRDIVLLTLEKLWEYRKDIEVMTSPNDEISYARLIENIKNVDQNLSLGIVPPKIEITSFANYGYFTNELEKMAKMEPHARGYRLESFLNELFEAFRLTPNGGFKIVGEQIDGSFVLHNDTYLIEAKWHSKKIAAPDLHTFQSKLDQKAKWTRGVFFSWQGFSSEAFEAWGRNKSVICMSGYDIYHMLKNGISFTDLLDKKIRYATEKGEYYIRIDKLYPDFNYQSLK